MEDEWVGDRRTDGVEVREMMNDAYEIVRPGKLPVRRCPQCGTFMLTAAAAKRVADMVYPTAAERT